MIKVYIFNKSNNISRDTVTVEHILEVIVIYRTARSVQDHLIVLISHRSHFTTEKANDNVNVEAKMF